jgi:hypothetical protein
VYYTQTIGAKKFMDQFYQEVDRCVVGPMNFESRRKGL